MMSLRKLHIFTDGSVHAQAKLGYGAYLIVDDLNASLEFLTTQVKLKRFEQTSSSKLELQTVLWALSEVLLVAKEEEFSVSVYTDCQNIIGLPKRRERLEQNNYFSSKQKRLNHYELYQEFYRVSAALNCEFVKVSGHKPSHQKNGIEKIFGLVDKLSRHALRKNI